MKIFSTVVIIAVSACNVALANGVDRLLDSYIIAKAETHQAPFTEAELTKTPYTIHVVSYINEKDAASHVEELKIQEKEVFYVPSFVKGQIWFKVCVGRFDTKDQADKYRKAFMKRMDEPLATVISLLDRPTRDTRSVASVATKEKTEVPVASDKTAKKETGTVEPKVTLIPAPGKPTAEKPSAKNAEKATAKETAQKAMTAKTPDFYTIQVGAYPSVDLAKEKIAGLTVKDQDIFYQEADVSGKKWYRVLVGRFASRKDAQGFETVLKEQTKNLETLVRKVKSE